MQQTVTRILQAHGEAPAAHDGGSKQNAAVDHRRNTLAE
jgi:hypothetical protein